MVPQGERVGFIGTAVPFRTAAEWDAFVAEFRRCLGERRRKAGKEPWVWPAQVKIDFLDQAGMARFASERKSQPHPAFGVAFLNPAASRLCRETGITISGVENPVRPEYADNVVDEECLFDMPIAGAR